QAKLVADQYQSGAHGDAELADRLAHEFVKFGFVDRHVVVSSACGPVLPRKDVENNHPRVVLKSKFRRIECRCKWIPRSTHLRITSWLACVHFWRCRSTRRCATGWCPCKSGWPAWAPM